MDCRIAKTVQVGQFARLGRIHSGQAVAEKSRKDFFKILVGMLAPGGFAV